jgi:carbon-monoxide dehydrogenase small subunit
MDGRTINSCLMLGVEADGYDIVTVEGLATGGVLSPLQQAFLDNAAPQCGFCIPGQLVSAQALLDSNPDPTIDEVHEALGGNLCRCAGYRQITDAVLQAAGEGAPS